MKTYLGDCLEIMRQMKDKSIDAVITDPPYGIGIADWDSEALERIAMGNFVDASDAESIASQALSSSTATEVTDAAPKDHKPGEDVTSAAPDEHKGE